MKYIKTYNESIRHLLKPKDDKDILKSIEKLSPQEQFENACKYGILWLVKKLLKDNRVNPTDNENLAIEQSSKYGHIDVVKELLKDKRVDPSVGGNLSILLSSKNGHIEIVKELLKDERVINKINITGVSPIELALNNGHINVAKELLKNQKIKNFLSKEDIQKYEKQINGLNESIRHLLKPKSEDDIKKTLGELTPTEKLEKGCKHGILWLVKQAIDEGVDPLYKDNIALKIVSSTGHVDILKYLLNIGVDPSINNNFAIRLSSKEGHLEIVKELLKDNRVDPSYEDNFALTWASQRNHDDICKELLEDKRVTKILSKDRKLLYGTKHNLLWLVKQAINEGANPVYEGNIPIRRSSKFGYYDIVKLLLNEVDKKERFEGVYKSIETLGGGKDGLSAIEFAFYNYHIDIVELFLEHPKCEEYLNDNMIKKYKDNIEYYKKHKKYLINNKFDVYNESIRHLLKPKSKEDILDNIKNLSLEEIYLKSLLYDLKDIIDEVKKRIKNYISIDYGTYIKLMQLDNLEFTISEKTKLSIMFKKNDIDYKFDKYNMTIKKNNQEYYIFKHNDFILFYYIKKIHHITYNIFDSGDIHYFLCPTFDILLKMINDKLL